MGSELLGPVLGTLCGLLGAALGVYLAWRHAQSAEYRKFIFWYALAMLTLAGAFTVAMVFTAGALKSLWVVVYLPLLFLLIFWGKRQERQYMSNHP